MFKRKNTLQLMESGIVKEGKSEDSAVKSAVKELIGLEKDAQHAQKTATKAEATLRKMEKQAHRAAKAMNNAIRAHEIAVADLQAAQKNTKLKYEHRNKLLAALDAKKACVESAINEKTQHDKVRESKLAELRQSMLPAAPPLRTSTEGVGLPVQSGPAMDNNGNAVGLPGQSGPAMDNNGNAAGYGVDYNRVRVNSEGHVRGESNHHPEVTTTTHPIPERGYN